MAQNRTDNIQVNAPKDIDNKKGIVDVGGWRCYNTIEEARLTVDIDARYKTQPVVILKNGIPTDYWWRDGIEDEDLIEKVPDISDATSTIKGKLKLTNHLGGTADAPIVVAVETKATSDNSNAPASTAWVKGLIAESGGGGGSYVLPIATNSVLGGIRIGNGLTTASGGVTSLQVKTINSQSIIGTGNIDISGGSGSQTLQQTLNLGRIGDRMQITESLEIPILAPSIINSGSIWIGSGTSGSGGGGGGYTLPISSASVLGGIRIGTGLTIDPATGIVNTTGSSLPIATDSILGGIKIGSGLTINPTTGVVSTTGGGGGIGTVTSVTSANSDISVGSNPTTAPVLTLNKGLSSGQIVARYGNGGIAFNTFGDNISAQTQGNIVYDAGSASYGTHDFKVNSGQTAFKINTDRTLSSPKYASGGTAPTTSGTTKMVVVDTNGLFSFKNEPALSQSLQQTLNIGRVGDSMQITASMQIPTVAPSVINTGNIWVGTGTSPSTITKSKVNSLSNSATTTISIGSAQASTYIVATNASAIAATVNLGTALTSIFIRQGGSGKVTFTGSTVLGSEVTVLVKPSKQARTEGQNAVVEIFYETANRVVITGDLDNI